MITKKLNEEKNTLNGINMITMDVPLFIRMLEYAKEDAKTDMDLHSATERILRLSKNKKQLTMSEYNSIVSKKGEPKEQTMSDASGSFEGPLKEMPIVKRNIHQSEFKEATDSSSSGSFDVPFGGRGTKGRKNPLKIDGPDSVYKGRAVTDKNWPRFGGPGGVYVKPKEKCKKFPYCNQGDQNNLDFIHEAIVEVAKKRKLSVEVVENIVIKEINRIFI